MPETAVTEAEGNMAMRISENLLNEGWSHHDRESERLADELEAVDEVPAELLAPFVHLAIHTIGEHMGDWPRTYALGHRILRSHKTNGQTAPAWERLYVAAVLSADGVGAAELELAALDVADSPVGSLLAMRLNLADALVSAGRAAEAGRIYRRTLDLVDRMAAPSALDRAVAVASNNLAWTLLDQSARSPDEDALMKRAADSSLAAWRRCGSWINEELALFLCARVAQIQGDAASALDLAAAGLRVIEANDRRPFDTARFHLLRASALTALNDPAGRTDALSDADAAGHQIAFEDLKEQYKAERAQVAHLA